MAKALMGTYTTPRATQLLDEVRALRARVAELEQALEEAEDARDRRDELDESVLVDDSLEVRELDEPAVTG